jgi:hypothetical protein
VDPSVGLDAGTALAAAGLPVSAAERAAMSQTMTAFAAMVASLYAVPTTVPATQSWSPTRPSP